jgi:hypothetical protein
VLTEALRSGFAGTPLRLIKGAARPGQRGQDQSRSVPFRCVRFEHVEQLQRLIDARIPEAPSLEYKRDLNVGSRTERVELLKDLTGMANGGGGTILFGVEEDRTGEVPVASELVGLDDRAVVGRVEDVARDGVRPPLLAEYKEIDLEGGRFVLAVDVQPSPLGPHMLHAYDQHRYFTRAGRSTSPMVESQVRAAYELAGRARQQRSHVWAAHSLPMRQAAGDAGVGVIVAGVPEEPLAEVVDLDSIDPAMLQPPDHVAGYLRFSNERFDFGRWADGIHATTSWGTRVRLHRDGAAGVLQPIDSDPLDLVWLGRVANAELVLLAWLWQHFDLRRPVELHLELDRLTTARLEVRFAGSFVDSKAEVVVPPDGPPITVVVRDEVLPWDLVRPRVRHELTRRLVARVHNAFGRAGPRPLFTAGQLYDADGPLHRSLAGGGVWADNGQQIGFVYNDGTLRRPDGTLAGWVDRGAVLDLDGSTCAVVEMSPGPGCPDDFWPKEVIDDPRAEVPGGNAGEPMAPIVPTPDRPAATGRWSATNLPTILAT